MSKSRLRLIPLEDRCTPASFVGNIITLDDGGEQLTISTETSGQYTLTSTVDVNGETGPVVFTPASQDTVSIVDSVSSTSVVFTHSRLYHHDVSVVLDDGSSGVRFDDGLTDFGAASLSVTTDRGIAVNPGSIVRALTGSINFSANMQAAARIGEFIGIDIQGQVSVESTGIIQLQGRGGLLNNTFGLMGVQVLGTNAMVLTSAGVLSITGQGGGGTANASIGVHVAGGSRVFSAIGELTVLGIGGAGAGQGNYGVLVQNADSLISTGGSPLNITGKAGSNGSESYGVGVYVNDGGRIASGTINYMGGPIQVLGLGGGTGNSAHNSGVFVVGSGSAITTNHSTIVVTGTGGAGTGGGSIGVQVAEKGVVASGGSITMTGTGGAGTGSYNVGVMVQGENTYISSSTGTGNVAVTGSAGANSNVYGIGTMLYNGGSISAGNGTVDVKGFGKDYGVFVIEQDSAIIGKGTVNIEGSTSNAFGLRQPAVFISNEAIVRGGAITITADSFSIDSNGGSISAGTGTVTIKPRTAGLRTLMGGVETPATGPVLTLTNFDLGRIQAETIVIGSTAAGSVEFMDNVGFGFGSPIQNVEFLTGGDIAFTRDRGIGGAVNMLFKAAGNIVLPGAKSGYYQYSTETLKFADGSKVQIPINGALPNESGDLRVSGIVELNNAMLNLTGAYVPNIGDVFTLVLAVELKGTFANTPDKSVIPFNGKNLRIDYTATAVTATVL